MKEYLPTIAKAITAVLVVIAGGIAANTIPVEPWVGVVISAIVAGLAVWAVPNTDA